MSPARVAAVFRRHWYVSIRSVPRLLELFLYPIVELLVWGLLAAYLGGQAEGLPAPIAFLIGGILLWDIVFRAKNGVSMALLEDAHTRTILSFLASPLTPAEYVAGAALWGLARVATAWAVLSVLAWALFAFGILGIGPVVGVYAAVLFTFGTALGLVVMGLVLRFGEAADELAWGLAAMVAPFAAVFYPVAALPGWAQGVSSFIPAAHVFESMRAELAGGGPAWGGLGAAAVLDVAYLLGAALFARAMFGTLRRRGFVTRYM